MYLKTGIFLKLDLLQKPNIQDGWNWKELEPQIPSPHPLPCHALTPIMAVPDPAFLASLIWQISVIHTKSSQQKHYLEGVVLVF